jgi:predicted transposase YdaD
MLITEWNWDTALAVRERDGKKKGLEEGKKEDAKNALKEGLSVEVVQKITGLDIGTIKQLEGCQVPNFLAVRERDGKEEGKKEDVANLSEYGMSPEQIAKALKLPLDKVLQYQGKK